MSLKRNAIFAVILFIEISFIPYSAMANSIHVGDQLGAITITDIECENQVGMAEVYDSNTADDNESPLRERTILALAKRRILCSTTRFIETQLGAASLALYAGGAIAACYGPIGAAGTIVMSAGGVIFGTAHFALEQIDCIDPASEGTTERQIRKTVCAELNRNGIECDPFK